jgi:hypothetical protein
MDLVRDILIKVEDDPSLDGSIYKTYDEDDFPGHTREEITYHIDLLMEAGFVIGEKSLEPLPAISRLTWQGHEFVGTTRDPEVWKWVKARLKGLPDVAISVIWELAKSEVNKKLGLSH